MTTPYYSDDLVTLYHGDCRMVTEWQQADVLVRLMTVTEESATTSTHLYETTSLLEPSLS